MSKISYEDKNWKNTNLQELERNTGTKVKKIQTSKNQKHI